MHLDWKRNTKNMFFSSYSCWKGNKEIYASTIYSTSSANMYSLYDLNFQFKMIQLQFKRLIVSRKGNKTVAIFFRIKRLQR